MVEHPSFINCHYWAVILGGSSGMGLAAAHKLSQHGMNICILHRDRKKDLERIVQEFDVIKNNGVDVLHFNLDGLKSENQEKIIEALINHLEDKGKIRLLLHTIAKGNLGDITPPSFSDFSLHSDSLQLTSEAMAFSLLTWVQKLADNKLFAEDARVLAITSEGSSKTWKGYAAVGVAKAGLESLSRYIASEYAHMGIRCNLIQAGVTDTPSLRMIPDAETLKIMTAERNPFKRLTTTDDVADAIYLLCLDEAAWISGAIIPVDGGEKNI